jgi:ASCH domain
MKALSLRPEHAMDIFADDKTIEVRSWKTDYRGDLLICTSSRKTPGAVAGKALFITQLKDIVPLEKKHLKKAMMSTMPDTPHYAWKLGYSTVIKPFDVKGRLKLYDVDDDLIEIVPDGVMSYGDYLREYIEPHLYLGAGETKKEVLEWWHAFVEDVDY